MAYKRFGGDIDNQGTGGTTLSIIGAAILVVCCFLALAWHIAFLFIGFTALVLCSTLSIFIKSGSTSNIRTEIACSYLSVAEAYFIEGNYTLAITEYRKALRHIPLPPEHNTMYQESIRLSSKNNT